MLASNLTEEQRRVTALHNLNIIGTPPTAAFDAIVEVAAAIFRCPTSLVSLIAEERQWFKARCGIELDGTSRSVAFCDYTISLKTPLIVRDASIDKRFKDNPLVTGEPKIRFYAGVPLSLDGELFLGALCVIDTVPRIPSDEEVQQLIRLGRAVEGLLGAHLHLTAAKAANREAERQSLESKRRETLLQQVERMAAIGAWRIDVATNDVIWSDQIRVLHELEDGETVSLDRGLNFYPEPDRTHVRSAVQDAINLGQPFEIEADFITARGRKRRIRCIGDVEVLNGAPAHIIGTFQDITDRKQTDAKLASIGRILDDSSNELYVFDAETLKFVLVNRGARENLGYSSEEVLNLTPTDIKPEMTQASFETMIGPLVRQETASLVFETLHKRKDGSVYPAEIHLHYAAVEQPPVFVAIVQDLTQRRAKDTHIRELAFYDPLTGLANRTLMLDHLRHAVERSKRAAHNVCLFFLDLDRFKEINDTRGHAVGDEVLVEVARRFQSIVLDGETLARIGGDEFVVVVENVSDAEVSELAERLRASLAAPVIVSGKLHTLDVSIGVAQYPKDSSSAEELLQLADIAMYEAKVTASHHRLYDARMKSAVAKRHDIAERLALALAEDRLELYYQPFIDLSSGQLLGAEALLRWSDSELGVVPPGEFISIAEKRGMMSDIGRWVIEKSCRQLNEWRNAGYDFVGHLAVNVAAAQLENEKVLQHINSSMERYQITRGAIQVEITESSMMADPEKAAEILRKLKSSGISIAIDDFGTGYSSLAYLKGFATDKLKIDMSFVRDLLESESTAAIVSATIVMAHSLGLVVLAEGVETEQQADRLRQLKCDQAQGYLFGRPVPEEAFASRWLPRIFPDNPSGECAERMV